MTRRKYALRPLAGAIALGLSLAACAPDISNNGHILQEQTITQIKPGVHTREDIRSLLGTPSAVSSFDQKSWYYIGERTATIAFFKPRLLDQRIVEIQFDNGGVVKAVQRLGTEDRRQVKMVERETPTAGKEITFMQQILGNFSRVGRGGPVDRDL